MERLRAREVAQVQEEVREVDLPDLTRHKDVLLRQARRSRDDLAADVREDFGLAGRLGLGLEREDGFGEGCGEEEGLPRGVVGELVDDEGELGSKGWGEEAVGFVEDLLSSGRRVSAAEEGERREQRGAQGT